MDRQRCARNLLIGFNLAIPFLIIMITLRHIGEGPVAPLVFVVLYFVASTVTALVARSAGAILAALGVHGGLTLFLALLGLLTGGLDGEGAFALVALSIIYVPLWLAAVDPTQDDQPLELFPSEM